MQLELRHGMLTTFKIKRSDTTNGNLESRLANTCSTNEVRDALSTTYGSQNNLKFKGSLLNQTQQLIQKDQNNPKPTANPVKKRPNANLSGIEREDGELKDRFGRASTYTYSRHIHTRIHTHRHSNGLYKVTESC